MLKVLGHLGWRPCSGIPRCLCPTQPVASAWLDSSQWPTGTLNLVASAVVNAGFTPTHNPKSQHGVILWP